MEHRADLETASTAWKAVTLAFVLSVHCYMFMVNHTLPTSSTKDLEPKPCPLLNILNHWKRVSDLNGWVGLSTAEVQAQYIKPLCQPSILNYIFSYKLIKFLPYLLIVYFKYGIIVFLSITISL